MTEPDSCCSICGTAKNGAPGWFLVVANQWQDRLKVLHWSDGFSHYQGVFAACGIAHVMQLVARWIASGTLLSAYENRPDNIRPPLRLITPACAPDVTHH